MIFALLAMQLVLGTVPMDVTVGVQVQSIVASPRAWGASRGAGSSRGTRTSITGVGVHVPVAEHAQRWHHSVQHARISHRFMKELQEPAAVVTPSNNYTNVTRDLGANNSSVQCIGVNGCHYHFERGDAGWISAFEVANAMGVPRIYFPRATYWFGRRP